MPDIKTALQTALEKAATQPPQTAPAKEIPADWDDEGGAKQIIETHTTNHKEHTMIATTTPTATTPAAQPHYLFKPTNNVTRETFEYVLKRPGCLRKHAVRDLIARGFKETSVTSLLTQMVRQGMLEDRGDAGMYATYHEYRPIKSAQTLRSLEAQKKAKPKAGLPAIVEVAKQHKKPGPKPGTKYAARKATTATQKPVQTLQEMKERHLGAVEAAKPAWSVQGALEGLSVIQAKALYDELKKLFG